ncbi:integrase family protein [Azospirillum sp. BE72]|uniref:integrase family protein n=1 Tax=Azospirillum sp. BE72 TaxID=2817776 RepID=UPI0038D4FDC8
MRGILSPPPTAAACRGFPGATICNPAADFRGSGKKAFILKFRTEDGAQRRMTLGAWPVLTVDDARRKAKGALGAASEGRDPAAEKQERKAAPTYDEVVERAAQKEVKLPAGLTDVRIHHLPHTFVSMLVSSGVPLCVAGRLAGHTRHDPTLRPPCQRSTSASYLAPGYDGAGVRDRADCRAVLHPKTRQD